MIVSPLPEDSWLFRSLDAADEARFRAWARENYRPGDVISPIWHPVVRDECLRIDEEVLAKLVDDANKATMNATLQLLLEVRDGLDINDDNAVRLRRAQLWEQHLAGFGIALVRIP